MDFGSAPLADLAVGPSTGTAYFCQTLKETPLLQQARISSFAGVERRSSARRNVTPPQATLCRCVAFCVAFETDPSQLFHAALCSLLALPHLLKLQSESMAAQRPAQADRKNLLLLIT